MPLTRRSTVLLLVIALIIAVAVATAASLLSRPAAAPLGPAGPIVPVPVPSGAAVLVGAGDIARCDTDGDEATARLLDAIEGTVFTLGDNAYGRGSAEQFRDCFGPTWGRHKSRTLPVAGNHDWDTPDAAGYRTYFGRAAAPEGVTWYANRVGAWDVLVLDSDCEEVGGCGTGSPQGRWLTERLAASTARCAVALWHHPRYSSGVHGNDDRMEWPWAALHAAGVELALVGHDHDYERFAPQGPGGALDDARGLRQFVVGTGGTHLRSVGDPVANSEVRDASTHGVLRLVLWPDRYEWQFVPVAGGAFRDQGAGTCR